MTFGTKEDEDLRFLFDLFNKLLHRGNCIQPSYRIEKSITSIFNPKFDIAEDESESRGSIQHTFNIDLIDQYKEFTGILNPWHGDTENVSFDPEHPENERKLFELLISRYGEKIANCLYPQTYIETVLTPEKARSFLGQRLDFFVQFPNGTGFVLEPGDHDDPAQVQLDLQRDAALLQAGIPTIRFRNDEIGSESVFSAIDQAVTNCDGHKYLIIPKSLDELGDSLQYLLLLPTLIARIENTLANLLLRKGWLLHEKLTIGIIERDLQASALSLLSFFDHCERYTQLYGIEISIPDISVIVVENEQYAGWDQSKAIQQLKEYGIQIEYGSMEQTNGLDLILDVSICSNHIENTTPSSAKNLFIIRNSHNHSRPTQLRYLSLPRPIDRTANLETIVESFLQEIFRKYSFRPGQWAIIENILSQKATIGLLPTSAGKSICYQLSAILTPGTTIIVDPIVALMHDQVQGLKEQYNITNVFAWHSAARVKDSDIGNILLGNIMVFLSPERLLRPGFRNAMRSLNASDIYVNYAVIDEAHCVSMWGHDFRPSYLSLERNFTQFCTFQGHSPIIVALTGTASQLVLIDLKRELNISDLNAIIRPKTFDRPELSFNLIKCRNDEKESMLHNVLDTIASRLGVDNIIDGGWGIIFSYTPRELWSLFGSFVGNVEDHVSSVMTRDDTGDVRFGMYSGSPPRDSGLNSNQWNEYKSKTLSAFKRGHIKMLFGNTAVSVGIDNEKLNYVINYRMPQSLESYYQQSGRAGRNGQKSQCYLLFSDDLQKATNQWLRGEIEEMPKRWDDLGTVAFFHKNNFPGKQVDIDGAMQVFEAIFDNAVDNEGRVIVRQFNDRTERFVAFWLILGVLTDYEVTGMASNTTYHLKRDEKVETFLNNRILEDLESHIILRLHAYLSRYRPTNLAEVKNNIHSRDEERISQKSIGYLVDFIYDQIGYQRREAVRTMVDFCSDEDTQPERLRSRIRAYFDFSEKFSDQLVVMSEAKPQIDSVIQIIEKVDGFDDIEHLYWETRRLLDERFHLDWASINLFAILYREKVVTENALDLLGRIITGIEDPEELSDIDAASYLGQLFSQITILDDIYGDEISQVCFSDIIKYLFTERGIRYTNIIEHLGVSDEKKNHLSLIIVNAQLKEIKESAKYSRIA